MKFTTAAAALSALAPAVLAELAVTSPVATTTCRAGSPCSITWNDNNRGVSLEDQGDCTVALFTGSAQQQTFLQPIVFPDTVNVATTGEIVFTPDPTVGESGRFYFIRFTSQDLDQAGGAPYLSFSAHFTLEGMTGTFNSTVRAQIEGASITSTGRSVSTTPGSGSSTREITTTPRATRSSTASESEETADNSDSGAAKSTFALGGAVGAFMLGLVGLAF